MDNWTEKQIQLMKAGGNKQCIDYLQNHGVDVVSGSIRSKYDSPAAELYKEVLLARVEGRTEPTELPSRKPIVVVADATKRKMQGFGSSPAPPNEKTFNRRKLLVVSVPVAAAAAAAAAAAVWFLTRK
jgi:hypothetical protein